MYKAIGRLDSKSLIKEGENEHGKWQIVEFTIKKQFQKKKIKIAFVAIGKHARFIQSVQRGERITVHWYPKCGYHKGKWYTELKVLDVMMWVSKRKVESRIVYNGDQIDETDFEHTPDQQLFEVESDEDVQDKDEEREA